MRNSGVVREPMNDGGYRVAYAVAEDNLCLGRTVIADSVNPIRITREAWADVARRAGVCAIEVEVKCSDTDEHRRRVESRVSDIDGLRLPTWEQVVCREYHEWEREHLVIDTSTRSVEQSVAWLRSVLDSPD